MTNCPNTCTYLLLLILISLQICSKCNNNQELLTLHVMPHTHNDAGWLLTWHEYYSGTWPLQCPRTILDNMVKILEVNPTRTYTYVEMIFFKTWFNEQPIEIKQKVKLFVANGQLTFPNGGWVMNDEACTYYDDIIEQMILGHRFLKEEFNFIPTVGWHLDPFGHSVTQASLFAQMGFNMFVIERIDMHDKEQRKASKNFEFLWLASDTLPENYMFTRINSFHYGDLYTRYMNTRIFVNFLRDEQNYYKTSNSLGIIGDDFTYSMMYSALSEIEAIEATIREINSIPNYDAKAFFSTPEKYFKSWYEEYSNKTNIKLTVKQDDFFPISDRAYNGDPGYWTGYFTSKASLKLNAKVGSYYLHAFRKFYAKFLLEEFVDDTNISSLFTTIFNASNENLKILEEAIALVQHHDGITGTAKMRVANDYIKIIHDAIQVNLITVNKISQISLEKTLNETIEFQLCNKNASSYEYKQAFKGLEQNGSTFIRIFNPGKSRKLTIQLKILNDKIDIYDENNTLIPNDKICWLDEFEECNLYFQDYFPSMQYKNYKLVKNLNANALENVIYNKTQINNDIPLNIDQTTNFTIGSTMQNFTISFCQNSTSGMNCIEEPFNLEYLYYKSYSTNQIGRIQYSGAYIFRPNSPNATFIQEPNKITINQGKILTQIQIQRIDPTTAKDILTTRIKLYKNMIQNGIEIETYIFPLEWQNNFFEMQNGREVIMRIRAPRLNNNNVFYTDANGMQMLKRVLNYKPEYDTNLGPNTATGNYYPVTSAISIQDDNSGLCLTQHHLLDESLNSIPSFYITKNSLMNDRSQGGTSLNKGEIELMLHRRIFSDDNRGLTEDLNEMETINLPNGYNITKPISVRTNHYLLFSNPNKGFINYQRNSQYDQDNAPVILYGNSLLSNFKHLESSSSSKLVEKDNIPEKVKMTIRSYSPNQYIVRLHNLNDKSSTTFKMMDDKSNNLLLSQFLNTDDIIKTFNVQELSLSTNQLRADVLRNKYQYRELEKLNLSELISTNYSIITLRPLEIRVFLFINNTKIPLAYTQDNQTSSSSSTKENNTNSSLSSQGNTTTSSSTPQGNTTSSPSTSQGNTTTSPSASQGNTTSSPSPSLGNTTTSPSTSQGNTTASPSASQGNTTSSPSTSQENTTTSPSASQGNTTASPSASQGNTTSSPSTSQENTTTSPSASQENTTSSPSTSKEGTPSNSSSKDQSINQNKSSETTHKDNVDQINTWTNNTSAGKTSNLFDKILDQKLIVLLFFGFIGVLALILLIKIVSELVKKFIKRRKYSEIV